MIYIVSGFPRSGTTAMMQALEAGGMIVHKNPRRTEALHRVDSDGYRVQPGDVFESTAKERSLIDWPRQYDGCAIKVVTPWLGLLAVASYRVVFMRRDVEEIRQSYEAAFGESITSAMISASIAEGLAGLANRLDVLSVCQVNYDDLLHDPVSAVGSLQWPVAARDAALVIDPTLKRFHNDSLVVGA